MLKGLGTSTHGSTQAEQPDGQLLPEGGSLVEKLHLKFLFYFDMAAVSSTVQTTTSTARYQPSSRRQQKAFQLLSSLQPRVFPSGSHSTVLCQLVSEEIQHKSQEV